MKPKTIIGVLNTGISFAASYYAATMFYTAGFYDGKGDTSPAIGSFILRGVMSGLAALGSAYIAGANFSRNDPQP